nr:hypothetical protein CFP56_31685 [Quercus suber]
MAPATQPPVSGEQAPSAPPAETRSSAPYRFVYGASSGPASSPASTSPAPRASPPFHLRFGEIPTSSNFEFGGEKRRRDVLPARGARKGKSSHSSIHHCALHASSSTSPSHTSSVREEAITFIASNLTSMAAPATPRRAARAAVPEDVAAIDKAYQEKLQQLGTEKRLVEEDANFALKSKNELEAKNRQYEDDIKKLQQQQEIAAQEIAQKEATVTSVLKKLEDANALLKDANETVERLITQGDASRKLKHALEDERDALEIALQAEQERGESQGQEIEEFATIRVSLDQCEDEYDDFKMFVVEHFNFDPTDLATESIKDKLREVRQTQSHSRNSSHSSHIGKPYGDLAPSRTRQTSLQQELEDLDNDSDSKKNTEFDLDDIPEDDAHGEDTADAEYNIIKEKLAAVEIEKDRLEKDNHELSNKLDEAREKLVQVEADTTMNHLLASTQAELALIQSEQLRQSEENQTLKEKLDEANTTIDTINKATATANDAFTDIKQKLDANELETKRQIEKNINLQESLTEALAVKKEAAEISRYEIREVKAKLAKSEQGQRNQRSSMIDLEMELSSASRKIDELTANQAQAKSSPTSNTSTIGTQTQASEVVATNTPSTSLVSSDTNTTNAAQPATFEDSAISVKIPSTATHAIGQQKSKTSVLQILQNTKSKTLAIDTRALLWWLILPLIAVLVDVYLAFRSDHDGIRYIPSDPMMYSTNGHTASPGIGHGGPVWMDPILMKLEEWMGIRRSYLTRMWLTISCIPKIPTDDQAFVKVGIKPRVRYDSEHSNPSCLTSISYPFLSCIIMDEVDRCLVVIYHADTIHNGKVHVELPVFTIRLIRGGRLCHGRFDAFSRSAARHWCSLDLRAAQEYRKNIMVHDHGPDMLGLD